eukprot:Opistho-2@74990
MCSPVPDVQAAAIARGIAFPHSPAPWSSTRSRGVISPHRVRYTSAWQPHPYRAASPTRPAGFSKAPPLDMPVATSMRPTSITIAPTVSERLDSPASMLSNDDAGGACRLFPVTMFFLTLFRGISSSSASCCGRQATSCLLCARCSNSNCSIRSFTFAFHSACADLALSVTRKSAPPVSFVSKPASLAMATAPSPTTRMGRTSPRGPNPSASPLITTRAALIGLRISRAAPTAPNAPVLPSMMLASHSTRPSRDKLEPTPAFVSGASSRKATTASATSTADAPQFNNRTPSSHACLHIRRYALSFSKE